MITVDGTEVERIPQVLHFIGNMAFEFASDDVAMVESYALTLQVERHQDGSEDFIEIGLRYLDRFEKRNDEWRIAQRVVAIVYRTDPVSITAPRDSPLPNMPVVSHRDRTDRLWAMRTNAGLD